MENDVKKVQAILFAVGKEITSERISSLCSLEIKQVDKIIGKLTKTYQESNNSLQIVKKDSGWKLTVKDEFVPLVSTIVSSTELERPLMETLAVIAWKYPIIQSEIIKLRSAGAYEHMRQLEEQGFIIKERFGRTYKVKLTKKFFNYFDLPSEKAKQAFIDIVPKEVIQNAQNIEKEVDEVERLIELEKKEEHAKIELKEAMAQVHENNQESNIPIQEAQDNQETLNQEEASIQETTQVEPTPEELNNQTLQ
jgi:segregation and condensation protein B